MIFGQDATKVPCFRNTFLYSISSGIGVGLATFLMTSRSKLALNVGFGTYFIVGIGYWIKCRYRYTMQKFYVSQMQDSMQRHMVLKGTNIEEPKEA